MNTTVTGFPGFAPGEHRQLLADVSRWARVNGWHTHRDTGWQNPTRLTQVDWEERGLYIGSRNSVDHVWKTPRHWPAANVRQAVDILVALDVLPVTFARSYWIGAQAALECTVATDDPWKALIVREGWTEDDFSELEPDDEVAIVIVRDSALPDDEGKMPGTYKSGDVAYKATDIYVGGDGGPDGPTVYARAQAMVAGLNAAEACR